MRKRLFDVQNIKQQTARFDTAMIEKISPPNIRNKLPRLTDKWICIISQKLIFVINFFEIYGKYDGIHVMCSDFWCSTHPWTPPLKVPYADVPNDNVPRVLPTSACETLELRTSNFLTSGRWRSGLGTSKRWRWGFEFQDVEDQEVKHKVVGQKRLISRLEVLDSDVSLSEVPKRSTSQSSTLMFRFLMLHILKFQILKFQILMYFILMFSIPMFHILDSTSWSFTSFSKFRNSTDWSSTFWSFTSWWNSSNECYLTPFLVFKSGIATSTVARLSA